MNILIAGDGEVGFNLAKMLSVVEDHNIIVVDPHRDLLQLLESNTDILTITGDSCSVNILEKANIKNTDLLISVLHDEQTNLLTCIIGKRLGAKKTIARTNSMELYKEDKREFFQALGVDKFVCPEQIASTEIVNLLRQTGATEVFNFGNGQLQLLLIRFGENALIVHKTLSQIAKENPTLDFRVVAIHRNRKTIIPNGEDLIWPGDLAYIITKPECVKCLFEISGKKEKLINSAMIIGAGRIGRKTALRIEQNMKVKMVEIDRERCHDAAEELSSTLVINGDATDIDMLHDEGIENVDALIAVTNNTESNILACLHAKKAGVYTTIALVENIDYIDIAQTVGIDTIINKKLITASYIARFTLNAEVESSKVLSGVDAEVLEFVVKPGAKVARYPIRRLSLPDGSIIGGIIRGKESYIAVGNFQIEPCDRVVVFAEPYAVRKLPAFFN
ncbi:MAG: Trk system potassium transporter TrkA [Bacteroidales bacterium]